MGKITNTVSKTIICLICIYRYFLSPLIGQHCRFHPTCSKYAIEAMKKCNIWHGGLLIIKRLLRCHPWSQGGIDLIPEDKIT